MSETSAKALPKYKLEVESLDLGPDVKAIGLELVYVVDGEPVKGRDGAQIWAQVLTAIAATEKWAFDFFAHIERVIEYCERHGVAWREAGSRCIVVSPPEGDALALLIERLEGETFGVRAGGSIGGPEPDAALEGALSRKGVDGYHAEYANYFFCGVCDFENGFLTLLTEKLWASEVIRRLRPVVKDLGVETHLPQ